MVRMIGLEPILFWERKPKSRASANRGLMAPKQSRLSPGRSEPGKRKAEGFPWKAALAA